MIKKWALAQVNAGSKLQENLDVALDFIEEAAEEGCELLAFPEYFLLRNSHDKMFEHSFSLDSEPLKNLGRAARENQINLLAGTVPITSEEKNGLVNNTAIFINSSGEIGGYYRKIHLFDVNIEDEFAVSESLHIQPGQKIVDLDMAGVHCGLAICYDLRFPELFRTLAQRHVQAIIIPSNFTRETGRAHWETLLRARAIENQCYIIAPNQIGSNPSTRVAALGQSMVIDPWGQVIARASDKICWVPFHMDLEYIHRVRRQLPALNHIELL